MDHAGFIAASYGLAVLVGGGLSLDAWLRLGRARRRLAQLAPRRQP